MLEIEKWAQNKSNLIALLAPPTAAMALSAPEAFQHIRERRIYGYQFSLPDYSSWFALYRSPGKAVFTYLEFISEISELGNGLLMLLFALRQIYTANKRNTVQSYKQQFSQIELDESLVFWKTLLGNSFTSIGNDISETPLSVKKEPRHKSPLSSLIG